MAQFNKDTLNTDFRGARSDDDYLNKMKQQHGYSDRTLAAAKRFKNYVDKKVANAADQNSEIKSRFGSGKAFVKAVNRNSRRYISPTTGRFDMNGFGRYTNELGRLAPKPNN